MRKHFRIFAVVAIIVFGGMATIAASYDDAAHQPGEQAVSIEIVHDEWTDIPGHDIEDETVTADGEELQAGDDYEIDRAGGSIQFLSDGSTTEGETAEMDYSGQFPADLAAAFASPFGSMITFVGILIFVFAIVALVGSVGYMSGVIR